jgi:hypothetical protein
MGLAETDITLLAADRLEMAVDRLLAAVEERLAAPTDRQDPLATDSGPGASAPADMLGADMVPRAEVEALAARLDETLARLRATLDGGEG